MERKEMTRDQKIRISLGMTFILLILGLSLYILPSIITIYNGVKASEMRNDRKVNYKSYTTPLSKEVVEDVCLKLEIQATSEDCVPTAIVYGPDFFDEIEAYFRLRPAGRERTYEFIQDKLGAYWVGCEPPTPSKDYLCVYDLRGDGMYPFHIRFDKYDRYDPPDPRLGGGS
jgi:hypothetical protein